MTLTRLTAATTLLAALAACGGAEMTVRDGPQAVHPSPFPLAQGSAAVTANATAMVDPAPAPALYVPAANDGSQPIID